MDSGIGPADKSVGNYELSACFAREMPSTLFQLRRSWRYTISLVPVSIVKAGDFSSLMSIAKIITKRNVHSSEFRAHEGALMPLCCGGWSAGLVALVLGGLGAVLRRRSSCPGRRAILDASRCAPRACGRWPWRYPVDMGDRIQTGPRR